jgi:glyoxylase-like metal-dependent hydrolase (beta-lactamase superfamily II)
VRRLAIPTPFEVGTVNAYLVEGPPLTLIDNGPNLASSLDLLEELLRADWRTTAELGLLVVTHHHVDHAGLTDALSRRCNAEVAFLGAARELVEGYDDEAAADEHFAVQLMRDHGVERRVVEALGSTAQRMRSFGAPATVTRPLADGDVLAVGDRRLQVLHLPGHSVSDTALYDPAARILFGGDHLLPTISSNALVARAVGEEDGGRSRSLVDYRQSLSRTRALEVDTVFGGHGVPFGDHRALIDERLADQDRRAAQLLELVQRRSGTAHDLARSIWGEIAITQAYLTLSEVLGHLDLLVNAGLVAECRDRDVVHFEVV